MTAPGVGAGTGALGSVLVKLASLLSDEYKMLKGVRKEIAFLERELRRMQTMVNVLADMEKLDDLAKEWKGSMRDLSYDMEDCIDRFTDRLLGSGDAGGRFMKKTARRLKTLWERHGIASQIKELKARVVEESERRNRLNLDNCVATRSVVEIDPRLAALHEEAKGLVAIDGPRDRIVDWLTEDSLELKVVAIFGGGGLGKTTLAMEAYRKIQGGFKCQASVSVSRTLDLHKLLKDVLSQIDEAAFRKCQEEQWEKDQLIRQIRRILKEMRYLIVIDDVWKQQDWKFLKAAFPDNYNGSRIIATTRITNVANSCCSNSGDRVYKMEPLNDVDSRQLFIKRIFHSDNYCPPQFENLSDRILTKCGGLPLAIITIASLLANKPQNTDEWERLQDSIGTGLSYENDGEGKGMGDILLLSYWDLPHHLKTCLLYLSIYPEDHRIECEELKWKWIAEGFVATQWGNLYQEAENYFNELVNRNMIQPIDVDFDGVVRYCQVHDMVLDLIISLSQEENFATVLNGRVCNSLPSKIRRLSMQSSGQQEHSGEILEIARSKSHVRSLHVFGKTERIPPLLDFHSLRVVDFFDGLGIFAGFYIRLENKHIKAIGSLSQLRYLRLTGMKITKLPEEIGNLQYLETLDLQSCCHLATLPSTMSRLQKLVRLFLYRHLYLPADVFGSMQALEEVSDIGTVDSPMKFAEELGHVTKLRKLSMSCFPSDYRWGTDYVERYLELLGSSLTKLARYNNLRCLHTCERLGYYLFGDPSRTFPRLQDLRIQGAVKDVPKGMASQNGIVKLVIEVELFYKEDLHLLMGMPSLAYLCLTVRGEEWGDSAKGRETVGSNGFKLLKVFRYEILRNYGTGIAFAPGAMPALRNLHLHWKARKVMQSSNDGAYGADDMGIEHLTGLAHLQVETDCLRATKAEVEALEGSLAEAIASHPNRHSLHQVDLRRINEHGIFKDEEERSVARDEYLLDQMVGDTL